MKPATWTTVAIVLAAGITTAAQDPVKVDPAHYKLLLENPSVRVLQITYPAGATSRMTRDLRSRSSCRCRTAR